MAVSPIRDASEVAISSQFKFSEVKVEPFQKQMVRSPSEDGPSHGGYGGDGGHGCY